MLLLFFSGATSGVKPPTPPAKKVGWPDTLHRKVPRKDLERLLELQKNNTFGRRWFREFERAQKQFAQDEGRAALLEAAKEARLAADAVTDRRPLGGLLALAAETKNHDLIAGITKTARQIRVNAEQAKTWNAEADDEAALIALLGGIEPKTDDDDEAILILLH